MVRSVLKSASILALSLFALPAFSQTAAPNDPYGYLPQPQVMMQPQPMIMPAFQAQQANVVPLAQYAPQAQAGQYQVASYANQAMPQPVTTPQVGVIPNYLPAQTGSLKMPPAQASTVGYSVQTSATSQAPAQYAPSPYAAQPAQAQATYGQAPQQVQYAPSPYAPSTAQAAPYGATPVAPSVSQYAPSQYSTGQYAAGQYGAGQYAANATATPSYTAPSYAASAAPSYSASTSVTTQVPTSNPYAPQASVTQTVTTQTPSAAAPSITTTPSSYGAGNVAVQSSIAAPATYDYASASTATSAYNYGSPADPGVGQQASAGQPQVQTYAYNAPYASQPQTYTTTQIYTPSPALTVQQNYDATPSVQASAAQAPTPSVDDVSLATDPSAGPWYFSLRSGLTLQQDTSFGYKGGTTTTEYEPGWQLGTGVGYEFKAWNAWVAPRAELELVYDQQLVDSNTVKGTKSTDPNAYGFQRNLDLFANGYLDFRLNRYLSPYIGGGVGFGYADFDRYGTNANGVILDDNDVGFAWQAMGGLGINLTGASTLDLGYRYVANTGVTLKAADGTTTTPDFGKHVIMVGFRNNF